MKTSIEQRTKPGSYITNYKHTLDNTRYMTCKKQFPAVKLAVVLSSPAVWGVKVEEQVLNLVLRMDL